MNQYLSRVVEMCWVSMRKGHKNFYIVYRAIAGWYAIVKYIKSSMEWRNFSFSLVNKKKRMYGTVSQLNSVGIQAWYFDCSVNNHRTNECVCNNGSPNKCVHLTRKAPILYDDFSITQNFSQSYFYCFFDWTTY